MPYKDKDKQREAQRIWASNNKSTCNKHRIAHKRKNIEMVRDIKELSPCMDCGQFFPYPAMQFDHRVGEIKLGNVATMVSQNQARRKIIDEIAKCDLVCANCHSIRTAKRRGYLL